MKGIKLRAVVAYEVPDKAGEPQNGQRTTSAADAAVADALDHLLDPLENLLEEFQSERPKSDLVVTARTASIRYRARPVGLSTLAGFAIRLCYSRRSPYRQIRQVLAWCLLVLTVTAITWLVAERGSLLAFSARAHG